MKAQSVFRVLFVFDETISRTPLKFYPCSPSSCFANRLLIIILHFHMACWCFGLISLLLCFRLIHCTWVYPVEQYPAFFGYYFFNIMLLVLQFLHIFWAYLILCMVRKFMSGNVSWWSFKTAQSWYHIYVTLSRNWNKRGNREYPLCFLTLRLWHWESTNQMTTGS